VTSFIDLLIKVLKEAKLSKFSGKETFPSEINVIDSVFQLFDKELSF